MAFFTGNIIYGNESVKSSNRYIQMFSKCVQYFTKSFKTIFSLILNFLLSTNCFILFIIASILLLLLKCRFKILFQLNITQIGFL